MSQVPFTEAEPETPPGCPQTRVRPGVVLLGVLLAAGAAYGYLLLESRHGAASFSNSPLYAAPVVLLLLIVVPNRIVRHRVPQLALSRRELCVLYIVVGITGAVANYNFMQALVGLIAYPHWYASMHPTRPMLFLRDLSPSLFVSDPDALRGMFLGKSAFFAPQHLVVWARPILAWTGFVVALLASTIGLAALARRPWATEDKLPFPTLRLPLLMISQEPVRTSRFFIAGLALPIVLALLLAARSFWPSVPALSPGTHRVWEGQLSALPRPWNAISFLAVGYEPWAVGLAYLVPLELSFSIWFFFLISLAQHVTAAHFGWDAQREFPYVRQQDMGAWLALGLVLAWRLRRPFRHGLRALWSPSSSRAGSGDGPPRWAVPMLAIGFAAMVIFGTAAGMSAWLAVLFFGIYVLLSLGVARVRAELAPIHMLWYAQPEMMLTGLFGPNALGRRNLVALTSFYWLNRVQIHNPSPFHIEALQLGDRMGLADRTAAALLVLGGVVATLVVFGGYLHCAYRDGVVQKFAAFHATWSGPESLGRLEAWLTAGTSGRQTVQETMCLSLGAVIVIALVALRRTLGWFPFHPAGYALAMDAGMAWYWFPFALAWALKLPVMRYVGVRGYRKTEAAALGLIAGDFLIRALLASVGLLSGTVLRTW